MKPNIVVDISPPVPYLAKFWILSSGSGLYSGQSIFRKAWE